MKKFYFLLALLFLFSLASFAQTPKPTATPNTPENDDDVVKISTTLIQVDVTVTDKNGKIVTDLKPEDFEVFENDKKQEITNFSFISNAADVKAPVATPTPKNTDKNALAIPIPPVHIKPEQVRRTIALVVDDLGISFQSMIFVRQTLKRFVDEQMQPNDLVAIIRTGGGIGALQQFTSDKNQLYSAIDKIRWNPMGRAGISPFAPIESDQSSEDTSESTDTSSTDTTTDDTATDDGADLFREDLFSVGTLGAINYVVKGMRELPGRKAIILFSDGFTICASDGSDTETDPDRCTKMEDALKQLTALANRSSVTIYSLDSKGLAYTGPTAADAIGANPSSLMSAMNSRSQQNFDQQEGLTYLAKQTGGQAFLNSNDFSGNVQKALEDQKGFYLVAYTPESDAFDPKTRKFNKLEVKVKRPGVYVRYRSGFFGVEDKNIRPVAQTAPQQMFSALSSPFAANGIGLRLNTLFGADKQKAPFIQSFLHIDAKDLKFTDEPNGEKKAVIDIMAMSFGENGVPVDQLGRTYTLSVKNEIYEKILKEGVIYNFAFPIKTPGAYQMRVAVRDTATSKIGSANQFIEVPDLKKGKLTLSGIVLQNVTIEQWKNLAVKMPRPTTENDQKSNPMGDTSLRQFKAGTVLRYAVDIYNAKLDQSKNPQLQTQVRVFRDGKLVFDRKPAPLKTDGQDRQLLHFGGAFGIGKEFPKGDYVLQLVIIDTLAKSKNKVSTQWIQFEVVE